MDNIRKINNIKLNSQEMFKIITSCISFYYPNLNQMMNRIMEEYY